MIDNIKKIYQFLINGIAFENFILFSIVAVPLSAVIPLPGTDVWFVQYLGLFSFFILCVVFFLWDFNKFISIFLGLAWYSTIFVSGQHPRSMFCLIQMAFGCLAIKFMSRFDEKMIWKILYAVFFAALLNSLWTVVQFFNFDPIFNNITDISKDDTVGFVGSHNQLGVFMSVTAPVTFAIFPPTVLLNAFAIFCSKTTSSWVGLVVGMITLTALLNKKIFYNFIKTFWAVVLVIALASYVFFSKFDTFSEIAYGERLNLYRHTINSVFQEKMQIFMGNVTVIKTCNMFFGYGLGSFIMLSPKSQQFIDSRFSHRYEHVHNDYFEVLFEMGISGFISMLFIIFDIIIKFIKAEKTKILIVAFASLVAHMTNSLGIYAVHTATSGMLLIIFLGIFYGEIGRQRRINESTAGTQASLV